MSNKTLKGPDKMDAGSSSRCTEFLTYWTLYKSPATFHRNLHQNNVFTFYDYTQNAGQGGQDPTFAFLRENLRLFEKKKKYTMELKLIRALPQLSTRENIIKKN